MLFINKSGLFSLLTLSILFSPAVFACIGETETYGESQPSSQEFSDDTVLETDFRDGMLVVDLKLCSAFLGGKLFQVGMQFKLRHPSTNVEAQLNYQGLGPSDFAAGQNYDCQEHTNISGSVNKISVWTRTIAAGSSDTAIVWLQFSTTTGQVYNSNGSFFDAEGSVKYIEFDTGIRGTFIGAFGTIGAQIDNLGFLYNPTTCTCEETKFLTTPAETVNMAASLSTGEAARAQLPAFITIFEAQERGICAPYDLEIVESSDGTTTPGPYISILSDELVLQSTDRPLKGTYNLQVKATLLQNTDVTTLSDPFDASLVIFETGPNFSTTHFVKVTEVKTLEASCFVDPDSNITLVKQMQTDPGTLPSYTSYDSNTGQLIVAPTSNTDHAGDEFTVVWECYIQEYVDSISIYTEEIAVFIVENICEDYCQECTATECTLCFNTFDLTSDGKCECDPSGTFLDVFNEVCAPCLTDCETCSDSLTCDACVNTFTLAADKSSCSCTQQQSLDTLNNVCIDCISNCEICSDGTTCDQCFATFDLKADKSECFCPESTFKDTINQECVDCLPNCKICSDSTLCNTCDDTFTLAVDKTACACQSNQFLDPVTNLCGDCPQNCQTCQSQDTCDLCDTGYLLFQDQTCVLCDSQTHELDFNGNCVQKTVICPDNCIQCNLDTTCTQCDALFALNTATNTCDPCTQNCLQCSVDGTCQLCENTYSLNSDSTLCLAPCLPGEFLNTVTSQCEACLSNCDVCQDGNTCDVCSNGFELFQGTSCVLCDLQTHQIDSNGICKEIVNLPCPQHCDICDPLDGICSQCKATFTLNTVQNSCSCQTTDGEFLNNDTQSCQSCLDPNCSHCSSSTNCNICYPDYAVFQQKTCVFCNIFLNELDVDGTCVEKKVVVIDDGSSNFSSTSVTDRIDSLALNWKLPIAQFFLPAGNGPYLEDKFQDGNPRNGIELTTEFELDQIDEGFSWSYRYRNADPQNDPVFSAFWGTSRIRVNATVDCGPADVFVDCYHYEYRNEIFISSSGMRDESLAGTVYPIKVNITNELNQYRTYTIQIKTRGIEGGAMADWEKEKADFLGNTIIELNGENINVESFELQGIVMDMVGNMTLRYQIGDRSERILQQTSTSDIESKLLETEEEIDRIYLELDMESVNEEMEPDLLVFDYKVTHYEENKAIVEVDFENPQQISLYETNQMRVVGKTKRGLTIFEQIIDVPPQLYKADLWSKISAWASLIIKWLLVGTIGSSVLLEIFIFQTYNFTALWQAAEVWQQVCYVHLLGINLPAYALVFTPQLMPVVQFDFMFLVDKFYKKLIKWDPNLEGQQNLGVNFVQFGFTSVHLLDNVDSVVYLAGLSLLVTLFLFIPCVSRGCPTVSRFREDGLLVLGKTFLLMPLGIAAQIQLLYNGDEGMQTSLAILGLAYLVIFMPIYAIVRGVKQRKGCVTKLGLVLTLRILTVLILVWGEKQFLDYQVVALIVIHVLFCLACAHFFNRLQSARSPGFLWSYSLIPFLLFSLRMDSSGIFSNCVSAFILAFSAIEHVWIVDFSDKMRNFLSQRARSKVLQKQMRIIREHELRKQKRQKWLDDLKTDKNVEHQKTATEVELLGIAKTTEMDDESKVGGIPTFEDEEFEPKRRPSKLAASMGILGLSYSRQRKNKIAPIILEEPKEEDKSLSSKVQTPDDRAAELVLVAKNVQRPKTPARNFDGSGLEDDAITGMGIKSQDDNCTMDLVTGLNSPRSDNYSLASPPHIVFRQPIDLDEKRESIFEPVSKVHYSRKASKAHLQSLDGVRDLEISFSGQQMGQDGMQSGIGSDLLRSHSQIDMESQKSRDKKPTITQEKPSNDLLLSIPLDERDSNSYDVSVDIQVQDRKCQQQKQPEAQQFRKGIDDPNMLLFGPNWQFAGKKFDEKMNYKKMYKWKKDEQRKRSIVAAQQPDINLDDSTQYQLTHKNGGVPSQKKETTGGLTAQVAAEAIEADRMKQMEYPHIRQWIREIKHELDEDTQKIQRKWDREEKRVRAKNARVEEQKRQIGGESPDRQNKTQLNWNSQLGLTFDQEIRQVMNNNIESFFESNSK